MLVTCEYDGCHTFETESHNARYCPECKCKRKLENVKKRTNLRPVAEDHADLWEQQEKKKLAGAQAALEKTQWILRNKTFAMFDIETTDLAANIGEMICACIKPLGKEPIVFLRKRSDKMITDKIAKELRKYDYIVTFYGSRFDIPFLVTRLKMHRQEPLGFIRHLDMYYAAKFGLKLYSNRQQVVHEALFGDSDKTRILGPMQLRAIEGNREALKYIVDHCIIDVNELERIFMELAPSRNLSMVPVRRF